MKMIHQRRMMLKIKLKLKLKMIMIHQRRYAKMFYYYYLVVMKVRFYLKQLMDSSKELLRSIDSSFANHFAYYFVGAIIRPQKKNCQ